MSAGVLLAATLLLLGCPASGRDVVPESRDVRSDAPPAGPAASAAGVTGEGYAYVARRAHGVVGLVGAHHMTDADAQRLTDHVADELEACAVRLEASGTLVVGALQLVAITGARGSAEISDVRLAPGGPVAANALTCIIAPLRATPFPAAGDAGLPAVALDATWSPLRTPAGDGGPVR
ncbi:MAG: hypothetical protein JWP97_5011 [Labilithrix sp.]|nr:hypothetical protein [Labilithrix sp.]